MLKVNDWKPKKFDIIGLGTKQRHWCSDVNDFHPWPLVVGGYNVSDALVYIWNS